MMNHIRLDRILEFLTSIELVVGILWAGLAVLTVSLIILMRTRWGQSKPLRKCIALSVLAHLLLAGYATTVRIVSSEVVPEEPYVNVSFVEGPQSQNPAADAKKSSEAEKPWERFLHAGTPVPEPNPAERQEPEDLPEPEREIQTQTSELASQPTLDRVTLTEAEQPEPQRFVDEPVQPLRSTPGKSPEQIQAPSAQRREVVSRAVPATPAAARRQQVDDPLSPPVRAPRTGIPTALLRQLAPVPRLETRSNTLDPGEALAGLADQMTRPARSESGEASGLQLGSAPRDAVASSVAEKAGKTVDAVDALTGRSGNDAFAGESVSTPTQRGDDLASTATGELSAPSIGQRRESDPESMPSTYQLRVAPQRTTIAQRRGASPATEAAVVASLKWLADNQDVDGHWSARTHGGGRELMVLGRDRQGAGIHADTGVTGLALLAFLASGHTHRDGPYRETVRLGLQYLMKSQASDGNLGGAAAGYARMYCHAMAAFALSEAYGMTQDERLKPTVQRAVDYTIAAQDPSGGGWRYNPGDSGDTSQAGWQLMVLKSAELGGIQVPVRTTNGLIRYLRSVSAGDHGGLASYRPGEKVSRPMTAEALVCWQFLGMPREHPANNEAADYLMGEIPGQGQSNLYYWYYGTLATYQLEGTHWSRWNEALKRTLVESQRKSGELAGSWDPSTVWGGYGGRVYSTAMAALCLEVYYRYLPMYVKAAPQTARRPSR